MQICVKLQISKCQLILWKKFEKQLVLFFLEVAAGVDQHFGSGSSRKNSAPVGASTGQCQLRSTRKMNSLSSVGPLHFVIGIRYITELFFSPFCRHFENDNVVFVLWSMTSVCFPPIVWGRAEVATLRDQLHIQPQWISG